jgi:hypothetical protein
MWYRRYLRIWPLAAAALLLMAPVESSVARLYKWIDEYGNVTYSERKPPDQQAEEIKVRTAPVSPSAAQEQLDSMKDKTDSQQKDRNFARTAASETEKEAEVFKKNCEIARQNRRVLENSSRIQGKDGQGNNYFLDANEIQAKLQQSIKQVELYCK